MLYHTDLQQAEFIGDVRLVDQTTRSRSDKLLIEFEQTEDPETKKTRTRIRRITAEGAVEVVDANRTAVGEKLVYSFPAPGQFIATVTAKPGEVGQIQWSDNLMRSNTILITQMPGEGDEKITRVEGKGKGYLLYRPMAEVVDEAEDRPGTIEVWYDDSGLYDEASHKALFDGNVRVRKDQLHVTAKHATVDFVKEQKKADAAADAAERLSVTMLTADDDVTVRIGEGEDETTAKGSKLVWNRQKDIAELFGSEDGKTPARVVREKNTIEAPLILALMNKGELYEVLTPRGGHMIGFSSAEQDGVEVLKKMDVTWTDTGTYRPVGTPELTSPRAINPDIGYARVTGDVTAVSEDSEITSGTMTVQLRREKDAAAKTDDDSKPPQRMNVTRMVATQSVRLKQFMPEEGNYRYGKADRLEWDREIDRIELQSDTGDALVWDDSNQWAGEKLVLNRRSDGRYEVESTGGQPLILYEESKPEKPVKTPEPRKWEPIY
jgi:lipopolysaccharide export system protein LptA